MLSTTFDNQTVDVPKSMKTVMISFTENIQDENNNDSIDTSKFKESLHMIPPIASSELLSNTSQHSRYRSDSDIQMNGLKLQKLPSITSSVIIISPNISRPPFSKQRQDINLLVKQYFLNLSQQVDFLSNKFDKSIMVNSVLYVVSSSWFLLWEEQALNTRQLNQNIPKIGAIENEALLLNADDLHEVSVSGSYDGWCEDSISISKGHKGHSLKPDLKEGIDYILVPREAWKALKSWYGADVSIPRQVSMMQLHLNSFDKNLDTFSENIFSIQSSIFSDIFLGAQLNIDLYPSNMFTEADSQIFHEKLMNKLSFLNVSNSSTLLNKILTSNHIFNDCGVKSAKSRCFICQRPSSYRCKKCSSILYCSQECQTIHWQFHKKWCGTAQANKDLDCEKFYSIVPVGKRGKVGLYNLGNSCYMNSSLQCLSHISPLVSFLLSGRYANAINVESLDGTGGVLLKELSSFFRDMWLDSKAIISPTSIKKLLGKINSDYAGALQHDAHEVTMLILDKLHEDLNRIKKKPYTQKPEGDGTNDDKIFKEAWDKHLLRENSIIQELIGSVARNEINCQTCHKVLVQFDYQDAIQLAIPKNNNRNVFVCYIPLINETYSKKVEDKVESSITLPTANPNISDMLLMSISVDKLTTMEQLKGMLLSSQPKLTSCILKDFKVSSPCLEDILTFEVDKRQMVLKRYLGLNDRVKVVNPDNFIALYYIPNKKLNETKTCMVTLLQRSISDKTTESQDNDSVSVSSSNHNSYKACSIGIPMLLPINAAWSCLRVRVMIFQQIERFIIPTSNIGNYYHKLLETLGPVKAQLEMAKYLPIRIVDSDGLGIAMPKTHQVDTPDTSKFPSDFETFEDNEEQNLGTSLSFANTKFIDTMKISGSDDISFLSFDWSHAWLSALNVAEIDKAFLTTAAVQVLHSKLVSFKSNIHSQYYAKLSELQFNIQNLKPGLRSETLVSSAQGSVSLESCLYEHTKLETLDDGNEWYCGNCKSHRKATKKVSFWKSKLPKILILSLKRFEFRDTSSISTKSSLLSPFSSGGFREKIEDFVDFPLEGLDLSAFCHESLSNKELALYDLFAVCNHYGRMGFGHYTAFARDFNDDFISSQWYSFDDDNVKKCVKPEEVKTRAAYILFYRKRA